MKYLSKRGQTWWYVRRYPTHLATVAGAAKYRVSIGVKVDAPHHVVAKAWSEADKLYHAECAILDNSDTTTAMDGVVDAKADRALKSLRATPESLTQRKINFVTVPAGEEATYLDDVAMIEALSESGAIFDPASGTMYTREGFSQFTPEMFNLAAEFMARQIVDTLPEKRAIDRQVKERAKKKLTTRKQTTPRRLSELWDPYNVFRGWTPEQRKESRLKKRTAYWIQAMGYIGDHAINNGTHREINRGLRELVDDLLARDLKPESVSRAISEPLGCFRWAAKEFDLDWNIRAPSVPKRKKGVRKTATREQQIALARSCIENPDGKSAIILMQMHGCLLSEIMSIEGTDTLASSIPHVIIPEGKTTYRKRVVPIAFGIDVIREHLDDGIEYLRGTKNDNAGATTTKRIKKVVGQDAGITAYSFRHAARNCFAVSGASDVMMSSILGWAGSDHGHLLHYGSEGIDQSEFLTALSEASAKAYAHITRELG